MRPLIPLITHAGDTWRVLAKGPAVDGLVFCQLASTTRTWAGMGLPMSAWVPATSL